MNWPWLSSFFYTHAHPVWRLAHGMHAHIAVWVLIFFVVIGLLQTLLAYEAGKLAVMALPNEVANRAQRRRYLRFFRFLGWSLFLVTIVIGLFNDKNQSDADAKSEHAVLAQERAEHTLGDVVSLLRESQVSLNNLRDSGNTAQLSPAQRRQLEATQAIVTRAIQTATVGTASQNAQPQTPPVSNTPAAQPSNNLPPINPNPFAPRKLTPLERERYVSAIRDAQTVIDALRRQDAAAEDSLTGANGIVTKWLKKNAETGALKDSDPIPAALQSEIAQASFHRPDYSGLPLASVTSAYMSCCNYSPVLSKFQTFQYGRIDIPRWTPKTVADLKNVHVQTSMEAEGLLGMMQSELRRILAEDLAPK